MKQKIILFLFVLFSLASYAQQDVQFRGNVVNRATNEPVPGVQVTIRGQNQSVVTDAKGQFHFMSVVVGDDVVSFSSSEIIPTEIPIQFEVDAILVLKDFKLDVVDAVDSRVLMGIIDETIVDDEGPTQEISSTIIMSNDVYLRKVGFQLSNFRFKIRGYENIYQDKYINGVKFNDQNRGVFNYSSLGALNDVTRNGDAVNFHDPNTFTYGNIGGTENINMRASSFARGGKVTASYTNRNYYMRGMGTYSTGLMDNGYAMTVSVGGRYSDEGQVKGTSYRNISYALSLEKQWNQGEHSLSLTTFGSPVERGMQGSSVQEVYDLVGDNQYNPNWGLQDGKKRNARMVKAFDPTVVLSHVWKINKDATLTTGYGMHYQYDRRTALNWYNGADPRPDYYRYIPSYFEQMGAMDIAENYADRWRSKDSRFTQIDWDKLIEINKTGQRRDDDDPNSAIYMLEARRNDLFENSLNSTLNLNLAGNMKTTVGFGARTTETKQFTEVDDLLGAQYVVDIDKYSERDFGGASAQKQNDLRNPNRKAYKDDIFGYNYGMNIHSANLWFQNQHSTRQLDLYYGGKMEWTSFGRTGKMQNGRHPEDSYGKGKTHTFMDFGFKGGLTYKFSGRHFLTGNINFATEAPLASNAYLSPRIWDGTVDGLQSSKVFSADINYIFSMPSLRGRVSVFQTNFFDQIKKNSYYNDYLRTFVHHVLNGVNTTHRGFEVGLAYQLDNNWSFDFVGTMAEYYYSNNPMGTLNYENGAADPIPEKVYMNNAYVGGTPQFAGTIGINYFRDFWFLNLSINGTARNYIDVSGTRRLASNYATVNPNNPDQMDAFHTMIAQERIGSNYTVDFSVGKIFYLANSHGINFNLSFNNILNRKNIKTGGYQQGRSDLSQPTKFANKYFYMQGFSCFLNASYRFK